MQLKPYPKYEDSDIQWIGKIPEGWGVHKLKFTLLDIKNSIKTGPFGSQLTINEMYNGEIKVYNQKNVIGKSESTGENYVSEEKFKKLIGFKVKKGDLLISTRGTIGKTLRLSEKAQIGILHPCLMKINNNNKIVSDKYIEIFIEESNIALTQLRLLSNATTIDVIYQDNLKEIQLILPPLCEQEKIVEYIDKAIAEIDTLIEKDNKLIELLKEKRISLINHAVTKGLDPNLKMKDLEIEWIGEIPENWEVKKLKFTSDVYISNVDKKIHSNEGIVFLCNYIDVYKNEFITSNLEFMQSTASIEQVRKLSINREDVIITKDSETIEEIAIPALVVEDLENIVCGYHLSLIRTHKEKLLGRYLFRLFQSKKFSEQFSINSNGVTRFGISTYPIKNILILLPPWKEQKSIAEYLDKQTINIDRTIQKIEEKIKLLEEYKKSLIHHIVTGKIDVREAV